MLWPPVVCYPPRMGRLVDLTGERVGRLLVIRRAAENRGGKPAWECQCDCGKTVVARAGDLRSGKHGSCGCLHREIVSKHGHATRGVSRTYRSWLRSEEHTSE